MSPRRYTELANLTYDGDEPTYYKGTLESSLNENLMINSTSFDLETTTFQSVKVEKKLFIRMAMFLKAFVIYGV